MKFRSLRTPLVVMGLVVTTVMALRAADEKGKVKDSDVPPPGTVKFTSVPAAVQKTFKDETKNAKIELLGKGTDENKLVYYKAIVPVGSNDYVMAVAEDGTLLEMILNSTRTELTLEECPATVQKALRELSKDLKVEAIERVTAGKRSDFIMDIVMKKGNYQVMLTEDGTLMSKVIIDREGDQQAPPATQQGKNNASDKVSEKPAKKTK